MFLMIEKLNGFSNLKDTTYIDTYVCIYIYICIYIYVCMYIENLKVNEKST